MRHDNNIRSGGGGGARVRRANARAGNRAQYGRRLVGPPQHHRGRLRFYNITYRSPCSGGRADLQ